MTEEGPNMKKYGIKAMRESTRDSWRFWDDFG